MEGCLFCKIANKEIGSEVVYEDDAAIAVLDINPCAPGHVLVLPRAHVANILELDDDDVAPVFSAVKNVTRMLEKSLGADGFTIGINHGIISGQSVDHLHVHIIPRYKGDGGGSMHSIVNNRGNEDIKEIGDKIKRNN